MEKETEVFVRYMKDRYCITIESPMVELRDGWEAVTLYHEEIDSDLLM